MKRKTMIAVLLAVLLVAMVVLTASAETAQTWYFTDVDYGQTPTGAGHALDKDMSKTAPAGVTRSVTPASTHSWWYSENAAYADLDFGSGDWTVKVWYNNTTSTNPLRISAEVWKVTDGGDMVDYLAYGYVDIGMPVTPITEVEINCARHISAVSQGQRLAIRIYLGGDIGNTTIYYNSDLRNSRLISPAADPGYPVPELPTIILLATGLAALAGYLYLTRVRNKRKHQAV